MHFPFAAVIVRENMPPVLSPTEVLYIPILQVPSPQITQIQASDPENNTVYYKITGVRYYENDSTTLPKSHAIAFDTKLLNLQGDDCITSMLYSYPRNLFCTNIVTGAVSITAKFHTFSPQGGSTFVLDIFVFDNGIPSKNITTKLVIRLKQDCTAGNAFITNLTNSCSIGNDGLKLNHQGRGVISASTITVPKANTSLVGLTVSLNAFERSGFNIGDVITYRVEYNKTSNIIVNEFKRRLIFDPFRNSESTTKHHVFFDKALETSQSNTLVTVKVFNQSGSLVQMTSPIEAVKLLSLTPKNYCGNSDCLSLYTNFKNALELSKNRACLLNNEFVYARFRNCSGKNLFIQLSRYVS